MLNQCSLSLRPPLCSPCNALLHPACSAAPPLGLPSLLLKEIFSKRHNLVFPEDDQYSRERTPSRLHNSTTTPLPEFSAFCLTSEGGRLPEKTTWACLFFTCFFCLILGTLVYFFFVCFVQEWPNRPISPRTVFLSFLERESEKRSHFSLAVGFFFPPTSSFFFFNRHTQFSSNLCYEYILSPM